MEVGINVEGWIFWKKLVHNSNKRGGWNKRGGGTQGAKSVDVEAGIVLSFCL